MSVGNGKAWRRYRNQANAGGRQLRQSEELKERFGKRKDPVSKRGSIQPKDSKPRSR